MVLGENSKNAYQRYGIRSVLGQKENKNTNEKMFLRQRS